MQPQPNRQNVTRGVIAPHADHRDFSRYRLRRIQLTRAASAKVMQTRAIPDATGASMSLPGKPLLPLGELLHLHALQTGSSGRAQARQTSQISRAQTEDGEDRRPQKLPSVSGGKIGHSVQGDPGEDAGEQQPLLLAPFTIPVPLRVRCH